ncbi:hypothetical protein FRB94_007619 [Tulasnella sp. JGI-2019a]|nr:hypothetical protein FRB93_007343 [Tulasnella sp. JGI-2019a]KAG8997526.1 hypothetical protein FRB94_007619 [Tulasnella sp. JGI-2019a]KAG9030100.1 hypothetical protein FRB95_004340 [Tulasnella sp. JGI-2019a]
MAGSKRAKIKQKAANLMDHLSPPISPAASPQDDGLLDDLLNQMNQDGHISPEAAKLAGEVEAKQRSTETLGAKLRKDPRVRWQERQARKAAALAAAQSPDDPTATAQIEREKHEEERAIKHVCDQLGLEMHEINPDGHCLFSAVADQLALLRKLSPLQTNYKTTRAAAANYMLDHPDDFLPFLPSMDGEDGAGATDDGLMTPKNFAQYCSTIRNTGVWGGEPEIMALSRAYNVPIHVAQWGQPPIVCHSPDGMEVDPHLPSVKVSYHRRMYGLGEHYNSLRPKRSVLQAMSGMIVGPG